MTWGEFYDCVDGFNKRRKEEIRIADQLNHTLGYYVRFAFQDPKHYPKEPFSDKEKDNNTYVATTDVSRAEYARIKYGRKANGANH